MPSPPRAWSDVLAVTLLVVLVAAFYFARLADQPLVGEETRWATGAREMLAAGDWIVPRQQGQVFPERPPMTMWLMAIAGYFCGGVDAVAIRLPSVLAVVLTTLVVYGYARTMISGFAGFVAAIAYASMAQVLQIGRMGESESVFALFVSSSLLLWHLGYLRGWPPLATWSVGFACAALGALTKGPQAPVYFVAITSVYLFLRRDGKYLVSWQYVAGAAMLGAIIAAWQIPFYIATNFDAVLATWAGLAADRVYLSGLLRHILEYPLETFASLLPWSPILLAFAKREMRELVADQRDVTSFAVVALAVAYPTVWLVAGAQARYFMPLYPILAVLVGLAIDRCSAAALGGYPRRAWHQFMLLASTLMSVLCFVVWYPASWSLAGFQPQWFAVALVVFAAAAIGVLGFTYRSGLRDGIAVGRLPAVIVIATFAGLTLGGVLMNRNLARWHDPSSAVAAMREIMTHSQPLVSLTPIDHRFAYYYGKPIAELEWPVYIGDLPQDVDYFCFMRRPGDTAESRESGRGRSWTTSPGTLPFAWEEVATLCVERRLRDYPQREIVLGRVVKPRLSQVSDATQPQANAVNLTAATPARTRIR